MEQKDQCRQFPAAKPEARLDPPRRGPKLREHGVPVTETTSSWMGDYLPVRYSLIAVPGWSDTVLATAADTGQWASDTSMGLGVTLQQL
eukprot:2799816-Amphidinium_carterae.1